MRYVINTILVLFSLAVSAQTSSIGKIIVETAENMKGYSIGEKMCWSYVEAVLKGSGTTIDIDCMVDEAQPGDIFLTYGFYRVEPKTSKYIITDGIGSHIAMVKKNLGKDCYLILEQNEDGKGSAVSERIINLKEYGTVYSLGYTFVRPYEGKYTYTAYRLVRGEYQFVTTNDVILDGLH
ncbi:MAG: hypothetical protein JKX73_05305 [Flavobacteriales bacterium]|nr:hypothetical protein [Flavobacteriales bacterium]